MCVCACVFASVSRRGPCVPGATGVTAATPARAVEPAPSANCGRAGSRAIRRCPPRSAAAAMPYRATRAHTRAHDPRRRFPPRTFFASSPPKNVPNLCAGRHTTAGAAFNYPFFFLPEIISLHPPKTFRPHVMRVSKKLTSVSGNRRCRGKWTIDDDLYAAKRPEIRFELFVMRLENRTLIHVRGVGTTHKRMFSRFLLVKTSFSILVYLFGRFDLN